MATDTIYALSSGGVPSAVAVVRISGPDTRRVLAELCVRLPEPRRAELRMLRRPGDGEAIDRGIVLWSPAPASYTGEDVAELQLHGSRAVLGALFDSLAQQGARLAEPGEFSRRAFDNGKLDLTKLEGLADLIAAETEIQRRQALAQARGSLGGRAEAWRTTLIELRAELEARLDFSDEADVPEPLPAAFRGTLDQMRREMSDALAGAAAGERVREGFRVAILGPPNAGKSSLLNAMAKRDVAIVTEEAGTTRDVLEVPLDLAGYPVLLFDTAGLRDTDSLAEREGVRRARAAGERADLVLWLQDSTTPPTPAPELSEVPVWRVWTKIDLQPEVLGGPAETSGSADQRRPPATGQNLEVSSVTGEGLSRLIEEIGRGAADSLGGGNALVTRQRQREAIAEAVAALDRLDGVPDEVAADLLRSAGEAIGRLTGRIGVEDVLDRLFAEFCIGK